MNNSFKILLKRKTAEQLTNMVSNQANWTEAQYDLILREVHNRGLDKFEEPEPWKEGLLDSIDVNHPKDHFERDIAALSKIRATQIKLKGWGVAALILVPTCIVLSFSGLIFSLISLPIFMFMATFSFASLVLLILKKDIVAAVTASLSILTFLFLILYLYANLTFDN